MKLFLLLVVVVNILVCTSLKLPPTFTKCDKRKPDFDECLSRAVQNAISQLGKPIEEYHLPNLGHVLQPTGNTKSAAHSENSLPLKSRNIRVNGFTKPDIVKAKMNFGDNTLTLEVSYPEIRYEFDYEAKGRMFLLAFDSAGAGTAILKNAIYIVKFTLEEYLKDNKKYLRVVGSHLEMKPESITFYYENLFKDKALNDAFNREMSESWKEIFDKFSPAYLDSFGKGYAHIFNNFLKVVPLEDLFDGV